MDLSEQITRQLAVVREYRDLGCHNLADLAQRRLNRLLEQVPHDDAAEVPT